MSLHRMCRLLRRSGWSRHLPGSLRTTLWAASSGSDVQTCGLSSTGPCASLPSGAQVVVCGGGVVGLSVAYHLTELGLKDVVLLEQGSITCGTTWHAAGLVSRLKSSATMVDLADYSRKVYKDLDEEGFSTGWKECGSVFIARTKDRLTACKRQLTFARRFGVEGEVWSPGQLEEKYPFVHTKDLEGAVWVPTDGVVNPTDAAMAISKKAKLAGAKIFEKTRVKRVLTQNGAVHSVETDNGVIECQYFVNCAGQWARFLGLESEPKVRVPLQPCEHYYMVTKPMEGLDRMTPVMRDYDGCIYFREWSGGMLGGGFEPKAKPVFHHGIPEKFEFQLLPEDWDQFQPLMDQFLHRLPSLEHAEIRQLTNGPESFTPDGYSILGPAPEVKNYFVAAGMNSLGMTTGPAVGRYLAEWIVEGSPSVDLWSLDVRRFDHIHNNVKYLEDRATESLGQHTAADLSADFRSGRNLRTSPLHWRQEACGARFVQTSMGYETPAWFHTSRQAHQGSGTFGRPVWFDDVRTEYFACREAVGLIDMSIGKLEIRSVGDEARDFLQLVCSNDVDKPVGMVISTGMQNNRGGYENDCSIVRLADNHFLMVGPMTHEARACAWLRSHLPSDQTVQLNDVTSAFTALNLIGPKAERLLAELTDTPVSKQDFPSMTCQVIDVNQVTGVRALRFTRSAEDGWILCVPSESAVHVYDSLLVAGEKHGIRHVGSLALRALRTEQLLGEWGTDIGPYTTPLEAGRDNLVNLEVGDFIGRDVLLQEKNQGAKKRLVQFLLDNHDIATDTWPWGGEPIYRNGTYVGTVTSTAYGFSVDSVVVLGYVADLGGQAGDTQPDMADFVMADTARYEVDIAGVRFPVRASLTPAPAHSTSA